MSYDLLKTVEYGGCSAKLSPGQLENLLSFIPQIKDSNILVDIETHDDAGVYKINAEQAIIFTTDFFPPICSDARTFGRIAAANSLSDVYAMGGKPLLALNIMLFPSSQIPLEELAEILKGGQEVANETGTIIIGGHTIDDYPPKYGLAVVGLVHPDKVITNAGAKSGDVLILTKPLGCGVIIAAQRLGLCNPEAYEAALQNMMHLNKEGADVMQKYEIRSATDVTGFGLLGHALKMAKGSKVTLEINLNDLPVLPQAYELLEMGCIPGAAFRNQTFVENDSEFCEGIDYNLQMLAADAQTSGGLLICCPADKANDMLKDLHSVGYPQSNIIGRVRDLAEKYIIVN